MLMKLAQALVGGDTVPSSYPTRTTSFGSAVISSSNRSRSAVPGSTKLLALGRDTADEAEVPKLGVKVPVRRLRSISRMKLLKAS